MFNQTVAFRQYLNNRQQQIEAENDKPSNNKEIFNEKSFYQKFTQDLLASKKEVIIYSPFVSKFRLDDMKQTIEKLRHRNIEIFIFTRPIKDYETIFQPQLECSLKKYAELGVNISYLEGNIHEKVAVIDREIHWEGSLNILSQRSSKEIMRRTSDQDSAMQIITYLGLNKRLVEGYKMQYEKICSGMLQDKNQYFKLKCVIAGLVSIIVLLSWRLLIMIDISSLFIRGIENLISIMKSYS